MIAREKIKFLSEDEKAILLYMANEIRKIVPKVDESTICSVKYNKIQEIIAEGRDFLVDKNLDHYEKLCHKFDVKFEKVSIETCKST